MSRRNERGVASLEFLGALPLILVAALAGIQLLLTTSTVTAAQNAARAGSRAADLSGKPAAVAAATDALPSWLRDDAKITVAGTKATVVVQVPLVLPGLSTSALTVTRRAELPRT